MAITSTISTAPTAPQRSDPSNFATRGDAFMTYIEGLGTEINTVNGEVNTTQTAINASETAASNSASASAVSAAAAAASAGLNNYQGSWSAGTYTSGQSVRHDNSFWFCSVASTTGTPGVSADWVEIGAAGITINSTTLHFIGNR